MIAIAVTYIIKEGYEDEALAHFEALIAHTRKEPGCRQYVVHRSPSNRRRFFLYEQYDDEAALEAHRASSHFEQHAVNGVRTLMEHRDSELYIPLD